MVFGPLRCLRLRFWERVKRTSHFAPHMSAFDPKRTSVGPRPAPSRVSTQIATITCLSLGGDYEATRFHYARWWGGGLLAASRARAAARADATGYASRWAWRKGPCWKFVKLL